MSIQEKTLQKIDFRSGQSVIYTKETLATANRNCHEITNNTDSPKDETSVLNKIRLQNCKGLIIAYPNINSLRNKFEQLQFLVSKNVDV